MGASNLTRATVTALELPMQATAIVAGYLSTLEAGLPLPERQRARIVAEIGDGLACSISSRMQRGEPAAGAAEEAAAEFGDPKQLAAQFLAALAPVIAKRTALGLLATGPLVGLVWVSAIGEGNGWQTRITSTLDAITGFPLILAITVPAALAALVCGRLSLRRQSASRPVTIAALMAAMGCIAGDLGLITAATAPAMSNPHPAGWITVAVVISAARLAAVLTAARRLSRLFAAGY